MATVRERNAPNSDIVYHVGHVLPWLAEASGQKDLSWIQPPDPGRAVDHRIEEAVFGLARKFSRTTRIGDDHHLPDDRKDQNGSRVG